MFKELLEILIYQIKRMLRSRLFPLTLIILVMFGSLSIHLFRLQIVEGDSAIQNVQNYAKKTVALGSTRGNIYDCNGNLLAYNELVQNVVVYDDGTYANGYEKNIMLLELIAILDRFDEEIVRTIPLYFDDAGVLRTSFSSDSARLRFLRDMFGKKSVSDLSPEEASAQASDIFAHYKSHYGVGEYKNGKTYEIDDLTALKCIYIRYGMTSNYYMRYNATTVAENIKTETVAAVLENADQMKGVSVEPGYVRTYNDSIYFSHIIGYTGKAGTEEIEELNAQGGDYVSGDVIGKTGMEAAMELLLQGEKGSKTMYVNNLGQIREVINVTDPQAGDNIYLSIDRDLQIGIYHLIENQLAGVLASKIVNRDVDYEENKTDLEKHYISIKEAYFQLINNNVLEMELFAEAQSGQAGERIHSAFINGRNALLSDLQTELLSSSALPQRELPERLQDFISQVYDMLLDEGILLRDAVDTDDDIYQAYRREQSISLEQYLRHALAQGWIDITALEPDEKYTGAEETYRRLVTLILDEAKASRSVSKAVYRILIEENRINRCDIALSLYEQGVLEPDSEKMAQLTAGDDTTSYDFLIDCIKNILITPAQFALDPCRGAVTVTDVKTGQVKALVAYPGYDNNRISEPDYYSALLDDLSSPLFNSATQVQTAPGSTFKMVTTAAALEEGAFGASEMYETTGVFLEAGMHLECWIYPGNHGTIHAIDALKVSCNDYMCEAAYRFSMRGNVYDDAKGLKILSDYASAFGLGSLTGIEIAENMPHISDTSAIASSIGQGTNLFSNVQLARYVQTIAGRGSVYDLTLLDRRTDSSGILLEMYQGKITGNISLSDETWNTITTGMHLAVTEGAASAVLSRKVDLAGKTGTAEENKLRPEHANFVSYAPFGDPEICVSVSIPHGYSSNNAAGIGGSVYDLYYGHLSLESILEAKAGKISGTDLVD